MKITLTKEEIKSIVAKHFAIDGKLEISISTKQPKLSKDVQRLVNTLQPYLQANSYNVIPDKKIPAIKELRMFFSPGIDNSSLVGLYEAKTTVENLSLFMTRLLSQNRLPRVVNGGFKWDE